METDEGTAKELVGGLERARRKRRREGRKKSGEERQR